jgi:TorA maturation chaperone TorD
MNGKAWDRASPMAATGESLSPPLDGNLLAAEDLRALSWLHREERAPNVLLELRARGFPDGLTLASPEQPEVQAMELALDALAQRTGPSDAENADALAADFAAIYLCHTLRASPHESVWRDEDQLMLQGPTFAVREFYRRHGIRVADWRHMADDHLCHQLDFVALLLQRGERREAARFMKLHLMTWLPDFAMRVAARAATPFYAALATLTLVCCEECLIRMPSVTILPAVVPAAPARSK